MSSSIESDLARVRALSDYGALGVRADTEPDGEMHQDVEALLQEPLDANTTVRIALLNNRELRAELRELGIGRGQLQQASLIPNPVIEAELLPERNTHIELRVEYDLSAALLTPLRMRGYRADLEAARYRAAAATVRLGAHVRVLYYGLQAAVQRLSAAQRSLSAVEVSVLAASTLYRAGNIPELTLAQQQASLEKAKVGIALMELEVMGAREQLTRVLGLAGSHIKYAISKAPEAEPRNPGPLSGLEDQVIEANLELLAMRMRIEALARHETYARTSGAIPDIAIDVHALSGDPEASDGGGPLSNVRFGAGVSATLPLFNRNQGSASALEAELQGLLERYHGSAISLRSRARELWQRANSAYLRTMKYRDVIVPAQANVTKHTLLQYNAMQRDVFDLLQAIEQEAKVQLDHAETAREYRSQIVQLEALMAGVDAETTASGATGGMPSMATTEGH